MLNLSLTVRTADDIIAAKKKIQTMLQVSDIPLASQATLIDFSRDTLDLWRAQLERSNVKSFKGDKVLKGDGYSITLKARAPSRGIIEVIKRAVGFG